MARRRGTSRYSILMSQSWPRLKAVHLDSSAGFDPWLWLCSDVFVVPTGELGLQPADLVVPPEDLRGEVVPGAAPVRRLERQHNSQSEPPDRRLERQHNSQSEPPVRRLEPQHNSQSEPPIRRLEPQHNSQSEPPVRRLEPQHNSQSEPRSTRLFSHFMLGWNLNSLSPQQSYHLS